MELKLKINIPCFRYTGDREALWEWMKLMQITKATSGNNMALECLDRKKFAKWKVEFLEKAIVLKHGPGMFVQTVFVGYLVVCCPISGHLKAMFDPRKLDVDATDEWAESIQESYNIMAVEFDRKWEIKQ